MAALDAASVAQAAWAQHPPRERSQILWLSDLEVGMVGAQPGIGVEPGGAAGRGEALRHRPRRRDEGMLEYLETKYVAIRA